MMVYCLFSFATISAAVASGDSPSIELSSSQVGILDTSGNRYWDLAGKRNVMHASGEVFRVMGVSYFRAIYDTAPGCGFSDLGSVSEPEEGQRLALSPYAMAFIDTQEITQGHLYLLKSQSLGYFAVYVHKLERTDDGSVRMTFRIFNVNSSPSQPATSSSESTQPITPQQTTAQSTTSQPSGATQSSGAIQSSGTERTTLTDLDGTIYTGEVKNGKPDGAGNMLWPDGAEYTGEWQEGKMHGQGSMTFADGSKYIGDYKQGKRDGTGLYKWANGDRYDGEWKNGMENGQGTFTAANGTVQKGEFRNGKLVNKAQTLSSALAKPDTAAPRLIDFAKGVSKQGPKIVNDRTFVPMRVLFEALGASVQWNEEKQSITASRGTNFIELVIGVDEVSFNGQPRKIDAAPFKVETPEGGLTYVPLRVAADALGEPVAYDAATKKVTFGNFYFYLDGGQSSTTSSSPSLPSTSPAISPSTGGTAANAPAVSDENPAQPASTSPAFTGASGSFELTIYKGYIFSMQSVVESSENADLNFIDSRKYTGVARLTAAQIKEFAEKPDTAAITAQEMSNWKDYVLGIAPDYYYIIRAKDGRCYRLKLKAFENQGKAMSYWRASFDYEEIEVK
ncbi:copper amine oxidase N-terminal domain-containing protein [Heliophilum fasciatum]|nr:copper amine oxidase N-terminal domain-containing protein [Heliophilum fasciatum]MCW2277585.1 hypothetical protein [Heliophilum fasciatum]